MMAIEGLAGYQADEARRGAGESAPQSLGLARSPVECRRSSRERTEEFLSRTDASVSCSLRNTGTQPYASAGRRLDFQVHSRSVDHVRDVS
jgi:hypothetical protein